MVVPASNVIPSLKVPVCSWVVLITFSNVVSRTWVFASQPLTVPVWVVRVFAFAKVPDTSFKTKWALRVASGAFAIV